MLHLRPIPKPKRKKCDTRALQEARARIHRNLKHEIEEQRMDAMLPRHFKERQEYRQNGGA